MRMAFLIFFKLTNKVLNEVSEVENFRYEDNLKP